MPPQRGMPAGAPGRRAGRVPARHHPVLLGDLVFDPDVEIGMRAAPARHEPAHLRGPEDAAFDARDAAHVVVGHELVDQLQASVVPDRLDEQPHLPLVELAHPVHRGHDGGAAVARTREDPRGFSPGFRLPCIVAGCRRLRCDRWSSASASSRRCARDSLAPAPETGR